MTSILDAQPPRQPMARALAMASDSVLSTALLNVVGGYVMGFGFSLFGAFIAPEMSSISMGTADYLRLSLRNASRLGRSFAFFGFIFGGIEVALEKRRGRKDVWNITVAGGVIGGAYGWRSYKYPGLVGGFAAGAAFSWVFEKMMIWMGFGQR